MDVSVELAYLVSRSMLYSTVEAVWASSDGEMQNHEKNLLDGTV